MHLHCYVEPHCYEKQHYYGNQTQAGMSGVLPPPTPVVTNNGRLGKGLSPDSRELRWKLFIGQVPVEVCVGGWVLCMRGRGCAV